MIAGILFGCAAYAIHDADGPILCTTGEKIRLAGVAARELDGSCRPTQPCPVGDPMKARDALATAIGAKIDRNAETWTRLPFVRPVQLSCLASGMSYQRVVATCSTVSGQDVSCLAITSGAAVRWPRYDITGRLLNCAAPSQANAWKRRKSWF